MGTGYSTVVRAEASAFLLIGAIVFDFLRQGTKVSVDPFPQDSDVRFSNISNSKFAWFLSRPAKPVDSEIAQEHRRRGENFARFQPGSSRRGVFGRAGH